MFKVGDIVKWIDGVWNGKEVVLQASYGVIERIAREGVYTVRWFDDDSYNDYPADNITLHQG